MTEFSKSNSEGEKESGEGAAVSSLELTERCQGNAQNRQDPVAPPPPTPWAQQLGLLSSSPIQGPLRPHLPVRPPVMTL